VRGATLGKIERHRERAVETSLEETKAILVRWEVIGARKSVPLVPDAHVDGGVVAARGEFLGEPRRPGVPVRAR